MTGLYVIIVICTCGATKFTTAVLLTTPEVIVNVTLSAAVSLTVRETAPEPSVTPLPVLICAEPVTLNVTASPTSGLLLASLIIAVTVAVLAPSAATYVSTGNTDVVIVAGAAVNVTACVFENAPIFATTLTTSAVASVNVTVATPEAPLTAEAALSDAEPVFVKVTVRPTSGTPFPSRTVALNVITPDVLAFALSLANVNELTGCSNVIAMLFRGWLFIVSCA